MFRLQSLIYCVIIVKGKFLLTEYIVICKRGDEMNADGNSRMCNLKAINNYGFIHTGKAFVCLLFCGACI